MRWGRRDSGTICRPIAALAAMVVNQITVEQFAVIAAGRASELRAQGIEPKAIAIRSGGLHGLTTVAGLPVVRLGPDSDVEWGIVV